MATSRPSRTIFCPISGAPSQPATGMRGDLLLARLGGRGGERLEGAARHVVVLAGHEVEGPPPAHREAQPLAHRAARERRAPVAPREHHLERRPRRRLLHARGALARGEAARAALDVEHAPARRHERAHLAALHAAGLHLVRADGGDAHRRELAADRVEVVLDRVQEDEVHARRGRLAHHLVEPVVAHRHHQQRLRPPLGRDDQPPQRAEVLGEALPGEQRLDLEPRLARRGLGVRPEQLLELVALVDEGERDASGQWPSLGARVQSSTQPEAREGLRAGRRQAVRGSASAAALAAAARARSWAARGGGVCWFASFSTRTAPIARARPSVSRRSARSTPFGASGTTANSSRQARSPPSPSW